MSEVNPIPRKLYITKDFKCFLKSENITEIAELSSNHNEADPRIALHAVFASLTYPTLPICAVSDDTDVFIILLSVAFQIKGTLYFRQGTNSRGITYHNVTALAHGLGKECCTNLPGYHTLTGGDFTYPFFRRTKFQGFKKMQKMNRSIELLETLGTPEPNIQEISNFILYVIYNRPKKEKSVTESRVIMMFSKKGKGKCSKKSTKSIPPDEKSLKMKILRSNFVSHSWKHCLSNDYIHFGPTKFGWQRVNGNLVPLWYEGPNLPTDEEYYQHISGDKHLDDDTVDKCTDYSDADNSDDESENEYASSNATLSSSDDEF